MTVRIKYKAMASQMGALAMQPVVLWQQHGEHGATISGGSVSTVALSPTVVLALKHGEKCSSVHCLKAVMTLIPTCLVQWLQCVHLEDAVGGGTCEWVPVDWKVTGMDSDCGSVGHLVKLLETKEDHVPDLRKPPDPDRICVKCAMQVTISGTGIHRLASINSLVDQLVEFAVSGSVGHWTQTGPQEDHVQELRKPPDPDPSCSKDDGNPGSCFGLTGYVTDSSERDRVRPQCNLRSDCALYMMDHDDGTGEFGIVPSVLSVVAEETSVNDAVWLGPQQGVLDLLLWNQPCGGTNVLSAQVSQKNGEQSLALDTPGSESHEPRSPGTVGSQGTMGAALFCLHHYGRWFELGGLTEPDLSCSDRSSRTSVSLTTIGRLASGFVSDIVRELFYWKSRKKRIRVGVSVMARSSRAYLEVSASCLLSIHRAMGSDRFQERMVVTQFSFNRGPRMDARLTRDLSLEVRNARI